MVLPELHLFQHFPGRPTAVITNPGQPQGLVDSRVGLKALLFLLHGHWIGIRPDTWQHQGQQLRAAATSPAK